MIEFSCLRTGPTSLQPHYVTSRVSNSLLTWPEFDQEGGLRFL